MTNQFSILITVFLVGFVPFLGFAQPGDQEGGFDQTQIITGDRTLTVQKAFKISELPEGVNIPVKMGELKYQLVPKRPATELVVETIEPAKVKVREPLDKLYHGFVKAGAGTFATPYIEAFYTSERDRDMAYGVHVKHISANDGINQPVAFSGFSETRADLWGKKIIKKHSLAAGLGYALNGWHYYGFDPQDQEIDKKDIRQRFNDFSLNLDYKSYYRDSSRVNHDVTLDAYYYTDRYDANELGISANTFLRTWRGNQYYTLDGGLDFISYQSDPLRPFDFMQDTTGIEIPATDNTNAIFHLTPQILLTSGHLRAMVGLGLYGQFSSRARFHAFPVAEVSYSLFNDIFIPYAGLTGKVNRTSYKTLTKENPYILSNVPLRNEVVKLEAFGGIRGSVSDNLSFNTRIGFKNTDDKALFVNDTLVSEENRFSVVYDQVKTFSMMGEFTYRNGNKWEASARGEWFGYETFDEAEAWHMPKYRLSLRGRYSLFDKLIVGAELAWVGKRYAKSLRPVNDLSPEDGGFYKVTLDPYIDLTLKAEYRYSTRLSVFVEANNLTGTRYDIYYRFPAERVFAMIGFKFAF